MSSVCGDDAHRIPIFLLAKSVHQFRLLIVAPAGHPPHETARNSDSKFSASTVFHELSLKSRFIWVQKRGKGGRIVRRGLAPCESGRDSSFVNKYFGSTSSRNTAEEARKKERTHLTGIVSRFLVRNRLFFILNSWVNL